MSNVPLTSVGRIDPTQFIKVLEDQLAQMEAATGQVDPVSRAHLEGAKRKVAAQQQAQAAARSRQGAGAAASMNEQQLEAHVDRLDAELQALESQVANADPQTKQLLSMGLAGAATSDTGGPVSHPL